MACPQFDSSAADGANGSKCGQSVENDVVQRRRAMLGLGANEPIRALALSGGGIRSATFSLGVLQAIAEADSDRCAAERNGELVPDADPAGKRFKSSLLWTFDYLSTVSGGGYLGGFICSLFQPHRLRGSGPSREGESTKRRAISIFFAWALDLVQAVRAFPLTRGKPAAKAGNATGDKTELELTGAPNPCAESMQRAADDAIGVLQSGVPGRMRSDARFNCATDEIYKAPLAWLRENGRYLTPTGPGDGFYVAALAIRNWVALHLVIGTLLVAVLALLLGLRALGVSGWEGVFGPWEKEWLQSAICAHSAAGLAIGQIWWSTLSVLWIVPVATVGVVLGCAYWLVMDDGKGNVVKYRKNSAFLAMLIIGALAAFLAHQCSPQTLCQLIGLGCSTAVVASTTADLSRQELFFVIAAVAILACVAFAITIFANNNSASRSRVALTRGTSLMLIISAVLVGLAVVDTLGQTLYLAASIRKAPLLTTLSPGGLAAALVLLARHLAKKDGLKNAGWLKNVPTFTLAGLAGVTIFVLVGGLWSMFVHWILWGGQPPNPNDLFDANQRTVLWTTVGIAATVAGLNGLYPGFINDSSLQAFYGSRLTRAYLGASNGERFAGDDSSKRSAAEPLPSDELWLTDYYEHGKLKTLAPVHIINVTVNKTVDPAEQIVQRDRKGQPLAVFPFGLALDSELVRSFPTTIQSWLPTSVVRPMSVGQWIGTSGAAFSTGIGRETSLGMSLLMGAANVRLGVWWPTGRGTAGSGNIPLWPGHVKAPSWLRKAVGNVFKMQRYLSYELRASFHGTHRTWQYLSDGGHFENTAIYELIRYERNVAQIFASDNGADPEYRFGDLANLLRLAKIDAGTDFWIAEPPTCDVLKGLFGTIDSFKRPAKPTATQGQAIDSPAQLATTQTNAKPSPCALLLYAKTAEPKTSKADKKFHLVQIVVIKPFVTADCPMDVRQYAANHPTFPQEPTADQFFDEAQWESYRALGYSQAKRILNAKVLEALDRHRADEEEKSRYS